MTGLDQQAPDVGDRLAEPPVTAGEARDEAPVSPAFRLGGYLGQFDSYRVIACSAVVLQHSFLWTLAAGNVAGWAFVMMLHFSRTAFFFLTAFVLTYTQITRPRTTLGFWRRRYVQLGVPYLAWTLIYWIYTLIDHGGSVGQDWSVLWRDTIYGYYQLYFTVVLFQLYFVFPLALRLVHRTRHHARLMMVSLLFALFLAADIHWPGSFGPVGHFTRWIEQYWPWSRNPITYQEQFLAGILVALHYEQVHRFVARWYRHFVALAAAVGVATTMWYLVSVWTGTSTGFASNIYQPIAFLWFTAVVAALECVTYRWYQRRDRRLLTRFVHSPAAPYLAGLTAGVYLSHVLFINLMRTGLSDIGVLQNVGWGGRVVVLGVATLATSGLFTALVLRTPLRWILGGPDRAKQRTVAPTSTMPRAGDDQDEPIAVEASP